MGDRNTGRTSWGGCGHKKAPGGNGGGENGGARQQRQRGDVLGTFGDTQNPKSPPQRHQEPAALSIRSFIHTRRGEPEPPPHKYRIRGPLWVGDPKIQTPPSVGEGRIPEGIPGTSWRENPGKIPGREGRVRPLNSDFFFFFFCFFLLIINKNLEFLKKKPKKKNRKERRGNDVKINGWSSGIHELID